MMRSLCFLPFTLKAATWCSAWGTKKKDLIHMLVLRRLGILELTLSITQVTHRWVLHLTEIDGLVKARSPPVGQVHAEISAFEHRNSCTTTGRAGKLLQTTSCFYLSGSHFKHGSNERDKESCTRYRCIWHKQTDKQSVYLLQFYYFIRFFFKVQGYMMWCDVHVGESLVPAVLNSIEKTRQCLGQTVAMLLTRI